MEEQTEKLATVSNPAQPDAGKPDPGDENAQPTGEQGQKVHLRASQSFAKLMHENGFCIMATTYQAGQVMVMTAESESKTRTQFRQQPSPMGIAVGTRQVAIGTRDSVVSYYNQPAVTRRLEQPAQRDGCFIPRSQHFTGNIAIHEMDFIDEELWIVNTRFSCLATLDPHHSFVPRWRPPFISKYSPEDRCHLNGMAKKDGKIAFLSALGKTDSTMGWRLNKTTGGILMEYPSGEIICEGLSMPHSPRWYDGKLWILESGRGALCYIDPRTGKLETVCELPGFTRGLFFAGPLAFIGLSKVRETNVFGGIQLNQRVEEKRCGIWVVNVKNGQTVAIAEFTSGVHEMFDVKLLKLKWPELTNWNTDFIQTSFQLPDAMLKEFEAPKPMDKAIADKLKAQIAEAEAQTTEKTTEKTAAKTESAAD